MRLVEVLTGEAQARDPLARGARRRVHARERRLPARALRRRDAQAAAPGRRPHRPRDHDGAARGVEAAGGHDASRSARSSSSSATRTAGARAAASTRSTPATVVLAAGGRCYREARGARRALDQPSRRDRRGDARSRSTLGAEARDLDALQYHPNGGAWPANMQGYSIPETTRAYGAVLLNADGEEFTDSLGPRDVVSQAIFDEVAEGQAASRRRTAAPPSTSTRRGSPEADAEISLPYMLRRYRAAGIDPLAEPILTYPVLHYQNGGLVIDTDAETTLEGLFACGEIAGGTHGRNRMMGNSLLECCVFGRRAGRGRGGEGAEHEHDDRHRSASGVVEDAAAHLYVWALKDIPQDLRDALAAARRARDVGPGQRVLADDPAERRGRRRASRTSSARTRASPSTPAASASTSRCTRRGSTRRCATAPSARRSSTRCARTPCTRSRARTPARTSATACRSCTGSSSRTGTASTSSACRRARAPRT